MRTRWLAMLLPVCALCGCGEEPDKPFVEPLQATPEELSQLYKWGPGPWSTIKTLELRISHSQRDGELNVRVYYPANPAHPPNPDHPANPNHPANPDHPANPVHPANPAHPTPSPATSTNASPADLHNALPVLLFSHGNWSSNDRYDRLIEHWVSHGYAVAAPLHRDGDGNYIKTTIDMIRLGNLGVIQARADDLIAVLDALPDIAARLPASAPALDMTRIAATGHSFGAFNAQQLGGASAFDTDAQTWVPQRDDRIKAVVAVSPPGPMFDEITEDSWRRLGVPTLMTTGTWDANAAFWPDWRLHKLSFETAPAGDQYALVIQGADHYLGNLIGRLDREEPPQHEALALINTAVVAFLDAYLKQSQAARAFLVFGQLEELTRGFAELEHR